MFFDEAEHSSLDHELLLQVCRKCFQLAEASCLHGFQQENQDSHRSAEGSLVKGLIMLHWQDWPISNFDHLDKEEEVAVAGPEELLLTVVGLVFLAEHLFLASSELPGSYC